MAPHPDRSTIIVPRKSELLGLIINNNIAREIEQ